jgi:hypothetical protein
MFRNKNSRCTLSKLWEESPKLCEEIELYIDKLNFTHIRHKQMKIRDRILSLIETQGGIDG